MTSVAMSHFLKILLWGGIFYALYLLALFLAQRHMMYPRYLLDSAPVSQPSGKNMEAIRIDTGFGRVEAIYLTPESVPDDGRFPVMIVAHGNAEQIDGIPLTRYWLIPGFRRPKLYLPHPSMSAEEIRQGTQSVWDSYYRLSEVWKRARFIKSLKARLAFIFISKLYRQMYASTGISTDSARRKSSNRWARWTGLICLRLFRGRPMPHLQVPGLPEQILTETLP